MDELKIGHRYKHFKGTEYRVLMVTKDSETTEERVVYQDVAHPEKVWDRPRAMFMDEVDRPELNYKGPRFAYLGE